MSAVAEPQNPFTVTEEHLAQMTAIALAEPHQMLDWEHRDPVKFTISPIEPGHGTTRLLDPIKCASEDEVEVIFAKLRVLYPDKTIYFWPPRLYRWWSESYSKRRLPIFGERDIDTAIRDAMADCNFGSWLLRSRANFDALWPLLEAYDSAIECPSQACVHDLDDFIARGAFGYLPFDEDNDALSEWHSEHEKKHGEGCECDMETPFERRTIGDVIDREADLEKDSAEYGFDTGTPWARLYFKERLKWLAWRVGVALKRPVTVAEIGHRCALSLEPLEPPNLPGVYVFQGDGDAVKIGKSHKSIASRGRDGQTWHAKPLKLLAVASWDPSDERKFHEQWKHLWIQGEWFKLTDEMTAWILQLRKGNSS
jgi:hypothetical protein